MARKDEVAGKSVPVSSMTPSGLVHNRANPAGRYLSDKMLEKKYRLPRQVGEKQKNPELAINAMKRMKKDVDARKGKYGKL